jgi:cold shock CspA family protein
MKRLGVVLWFDNSSGEGEVLDLAVGKIFYLHYSAIKSVEEFKTVGKNDYVEFKLYRNLYMSQIDNLKVLEPDTDYIKVNTCLELSFRRGVDILKTAPKYDIEGL